MRRTLPSIAFITLIASAVAGCAADGTSGGSGPSGLPTAGGPSAVQPQSEESRVQAFLDAQYLRTDVLHEFRTKAGDDIDCVDFAAEPGVRALVAQGTPIEALRVAAGSTLPEAEQERSRTAATNDAYFTGEPDELGRARVCPEGTSPHVRISGEQITAAGGLEAFLADRTAKGPPPAMVAQGNASCPYINVSDYQWITGGWTDTFTAAGGKDYSVANLGGQSTMTIAQPVVPAGPDHSLQETWTVGYDPKTCVTQTVEAGWVVSSGVNGDLAPHV
ncbi:MAG TPA: hypothetical protein VIF09_13235, partial [Polyangiaceae bacterium]